MIVCSLYGNEISVQNRNWDKSSLWVEVEFFSTRGFKIDKPSTTISFEPNSYQTVWASHFKSGSLVNFLTSNDRPSMTGSWELKFPKKKSFKIRQIGCQYLLWFLLQKLRSTIFHDNVTLGWMRYLMTFKSRYHESTTETFFLIFLNDKKWLQGVFVKGYSLTIWNLVELYLAFLWQLGMK